MKKTKIVNGISFRTTEDGSTCCVGFDGDGQFVRPAVERMCDACRRHFGCAPPDPYHQGLATLRTAESATLRTSAESTFEDGWKAERLEALDAERARRDAVAPRLKTLTAEELATYASPDPFRAGIEVLQARDARARIIKESR